MSFTASYWETCHCHTLHAWLIDHCVLLSNQRHLRSAKRNLLHLPRHRLSTYGYRAFAIAVPSARSSLPSHVCNLLKHYRSHGTSALSQWRRLHGAQGGTCPPLIQMAGHGDTVSRRTANKKETDQTVLTITKALTKTTNCAFRAKKWRGTTKKIFRRRCPLSLWTDAPPQLSNSFRRHLSRAIRRIIN